MSINDLDKPIVKLFSFEGKYYVYDTYTNKLIMISKDHYFELNELISLGIQNYLKLDKKTKCYNDVSLLIKKGLFRASFIKKIEHIDSKNIPYLLDRCIQDITLQVTKDCNFRCRYCLFANESGIERTHEKTNMSWEIARKSIDFLFDHSIDVDEVTVAFYGGEPLLNFELIKSVVEYVEASFYLKKKKYVMTINGSLLTEEIIAFLVKHNFLLTISFDGPYDVQNQHRKFYHTGEGTFEKVYKNILHLKNSFAEFFHSNVSFIPVLFVDEVPEITIDFFESLGVPKDKVKIHNANLSGIDYDVNYFKLMEDTNVSKAMIYDVDPDYENRMEIIFQDKGVIPDTWQHDGPCIPGVNRLFVATDGSFFPCERIVSSENLSIGNVNTGLEIDKIIEYSNIGKLTELQCKNCWAMRFCNICLAQCIDVECFHPTMDQKSQACKWHKEKALLYLKKYIKNIENQSELTDKS